MDGMESLLNASLRRFGALGWAALLPVVMLVCTVYWECALRGRDIPLPQGSGTTDGYPLHALVFGDGLPHVVDSTTGVVMLALPAPIRRRQRRVLAVLAYLNALLSVMLPAVG
jgi:hypothetical protein